MAFPSPARVTSDSLARRLVDLCGVIGKLQSVGRASRLCLGSMQFRQETHAPLAICLNMCAQPVFSDLGCCEIGEIDLFSALFTIIA